LKNRRDRRNRSVIAKIGKPEGEGACAPQAKEKARPAPGWLGEGTQKSGDPVIGCFGDRKTRKA
jgi:hypothetical protein